MIKWVPYPDEVQLGHPAGEFKGGLFAGESDAPKEGFLLNHS